MMSRSLVLLMLCMAAALAAESRPFAGAGLEERRGAVVPDDLALIAGDGRPTTLGAVRGGRPLLLVPAYYGCPMLCGMVIDGVGDGLDALGWRPGERFAVATVSFDPGDTSAAARAHEAAARARFTGVLRGAPWPFLTASPASAARLLAAIGMTVDRDPATGMIAHPATLVVLAGDGRISQYLLGIEFPARDLRLALTAAGEGRIGSAWDRALLYCYHYDPASHRYGLAVARGLRLAAIASAVIAGLAIAAAIARRRRTAPGRGAA